MKNELITREEALTYLDQGNSPTSKYLYRILNSLSWDNDDPPTPSEFQEKTITITENGETIVMPDENYDALSKVTVLTEVSTDDVPFIKSTTWEETNYPTQLAAPDKSIASTYNVYFYNSIVYISSNNSNNPGFYAFNLKDKTWHTLKDNGFNWRVIQLFDGSIYFWSSSSGTGLYKIQQNGIIFKLISGSETLYNLNIIEVENKVFVSVNNTGEQYLGLWELDKIAEQLIKISDIGSYWGHSIKVSQAEYLFSSTSSSSLGILYLNDITKETQLLWNLGNSWFNDPTRLYYLENGDILISGGSLTVGYSGLYLYDVLQKTITQLYATGYGAINIIAVVNNGDILYSITNGSGLFIYDIQNKITESAFDSSFSTTTAFINNIYVTLTGEIFTSSTLSTTSLMGLFWYNVEIKKFERLFATGYNYTKWFEDQGILFVSNTTSSVGIFAWNPNTKTFDQLLTSGYNCNLLDLDGNKYISFTNGLTGIRQYNKNTHSFDTKYPTQYWTVAKKVDDDHYIIASTGNYGALRYTISTKTFEVARSTVDGTTFSNLTSTYLGNLLEIEGEIYGFPTTSQLFFYRWDVSLQAFWRIPTTTFSPILNELLIRKGTIFIGNRASSLLCYWDTINKIPVKLEDCGIASLQEDFINSTVFYNTNNLFVWNAELKKLERLPFSIHSAWVRLTKNYWGILGSELSAPLININTTTLTETRAVLLSLQHTVPNTDWVINRSGMIVKLKDTYPMEVFIPEGRIANNAAFIGDDVGNVAIPTYNTLIYNIKSL